MNEKYILPGTPESRIETAIETLKKEKVSSSLMMKTAKMKEI